MHILYSSICIGIVEFSSADMASYIYSKPKRIIIQMKLNHPPVKMEISVSLEALQIYPTREDLKYVEETSGDLCALNLSIHMT